MKKTTFGLYQNITDLDHTLKSLSDKDYTKNDISLISKESTIGKVTIENDMSKGVASGAKKGGLVGGVLGLLAGVGTLTLPGLSALFITGPIVAAFGLTGVVGATATGALTGAIAGGLVAGLKEIGIDERIAKTYEDKINEGYMLLCVFLKDEAEADEIEDVMENNNAKEVNTLDLKVT